MVNPQEIARSISISPISTTQCINAKSDVIWWRLETTDLIGEEPGKVDCPQIVHRRPHYLHPGWQTRTRETRRRNRRRKQHDPGQSRPEQLIDRALRSAIN